MGFRSAVANGRLLQVRRKGSSRMVFFSGNFGIWEQWELVGGKISEPWSCQRLSFRSRNLPQVHWAFEALQHGPLVCWICTFV